MARSAFAPFFESPVPITLFSGLFFVRSPSSAFHPLPRRHPRAIFALALSSLPAVLVHPRPVFVALLHRPRMPPFRGCHQSTLSICNGDSLCPSRKGPGALDERGWPPLRPLFGPPREPRKSSVDPRSKKVLAAAGLVPILSDPFSVRSDFLRASCCSLGLFSLFLSICSFRGSILSSCFLSFSFLHRHMYIRGSAVV